MGLILFSLTLTCTIAIAFNLYVFELNKTITMELFIALVDLSAELEITFAYFYISERITTDLLKIDQIFYDSPWYRLSTKQQKFLVLPIQRAQRTVRLSSLGLIECSLPVFALVNICDGFRYRR